MNVYRIGAIFDNPLFEGLFHEQLILCGFHPSDWTKNPTTWEAPRLQGTWTRTPVEGNVRAFNDFPCFGSCPAFSSRAVDLLRDILASNGELLPLAHPSGTYYAYNCTTLSNCLDIEKNYPGKRGQPFDINANYHFFDDLLDGLTIFRLRVEPFHLYCTQPFVDHVQVCGLQGFNFVRVWPLTEDFTFFQEERRVRNLSTKLRPTEGPPLEIKGNTLVLRLFLEKKKPNKAERALADRMVNELVALLFDPTQRDMQNYYGNVEDHEFVDFEYRIFLSAPDCNRLIEKLRPYLKAAPWPGKLQIVKRFGEYVDRSSPVEYVSL